MGVGTFHETSVYHQPDQYIFCANVLNFLSIFDREPPVFSEIFTGFWRRIPQFWRFFARPDWSIWQPVRVITAGIYYNI